MQQERGLGEVEFLSKLTVISHLEKIAFLITIYRKLQTFSKCHKNSLLSELTENMLPEQSLLITAFRSME